MEERGRGRQRVLHCVCGLSACVWEEGWLCTLPPLLCFPPAPTPAETGHPWPTYSATLTPAHVYCYHLCLKLTCTLPVSSAHSHALQRNNHMFALCHRCSHCFYIFICLFVSDDPTRVQFPRCCLFSEVVSSWLFLPRLENRSWSLQSNHMPSIQSRAPETRRLLRQPGPSRIKRPQVTLWLGGN